MPNWKKLIVSGSDARLNSLFTTGNITGSIISGSFNGDGTNIVNIQSSSFSETSLTASYALNAQGAGFPFSGSAVITGSLVVTERLTAREFFTEYVSSSIVFESGSTKFGDSPDDTHQFTGSLEVDGTIYGNLEGTSSFATQALTASFALNAGGGAGVGFPFSGSAVITGSLNVVNSDLTSIANVRNNTLFLNGFEVFNVTNLENMVVLEENPTILQFTTVISNDGQIVLNS